jgi:predicted O-methyltransferase YrrM
MRPAALVAALNELVLGGRRTVVELGSGISTIVVARLLAERGGTVTALEHDVSWAGWVRTQLEREGLTGSAEVIVSPLEPHGATWAGAPWYGTEAVALLPGTIELLLVDGPPGYGEGMSHSRYPAMPALESRLAANAVVILDDADREAEREIAARWGEECSEWDFGVDASAGFAMGRRAAQD